MKVVRKHIASVTVGCIPITALSLRDAALLMTNGDHARCANLLTALNYMSSLAASALALPRPRASAKGRAAGDALRPLHSISN